jgi:hypothetical protein
MDTPPPRVFCDKSAEMLGNKGVSVPDSDKEFVRV